MNFAGEAVASGSFLNTDLIFPSEAILAMDSVDSQDETYLQKLIAYGFRNSGLDRERLKRASFLVGGPGLGAGSSRQYAAEVLKAYGLVGVIADSIYPIFYRNLWNVGLFALPVAGAGAAIQTGDSLIVDVAHGTIHNQSRGINLLSKQVPRRLLDVLAAGGLLEYLRTQPDGKQETIHG